jgi:glycosyltransferase involved in cell wall biosynthesis
MDNLKISLALTTYNRFDTFLQKNVDKYLNNPYISEIVITDDCSDDYDKLVKKYGNIEKIKLFRNDVNMDCYRNKIITANNTTGDWICLMDSDNFCDLDYFEALFEFWNIHGKDENMVYLPSKLKPAFDFTRNNNLIIDKSNWNNYVMTECCMLNACNFVFHKSILKYQDDTSFDPAGIDSKFINLKWIQNGVKLAIVPNMEYEHALHDNSHYNMNVRKTEKIKETIHWYV